jgi:hypothetical protein
MMEDSKRCANCDSKDKRCMPATGEVCGDWKERKERKEHQVIFGGNHCFVCRKSYMPNLKICPDCGKTLVPQR